MLIKVTFFLCTKFNNYTFSLKLNESHNVGVDMFKIMCLVKRMAVRILLRTLTDRDGI